jgi:hypothetical protein
VRSARAISLLVFLPTIVAAAVVTDEGPGAARRTNGANFRDRVLASCLARAYGDSPAGGDARATTSILTEWAYFDVEKAGAAPDALVDSFLKRQYHNPLEGYEGARFELLKCLDLYHSKQLDELVGTVVPHPTWIGPRPPSRGSR